MKNKFPFDKPLLAIFAHPDDESFLAGGALALAAKRTSVKVVIATPGQKGRSHIDYEISDKNLGDLRRRETEEAMKALGVEDYVILDYEDGALDRTDEKEITERLAAIVKDFNPASVLTFGPDGITGHRDHIAIGRFATKAVKVHGVQVYWLARPRSQQNLVRSRDWAKTKKYYGEIPPVPYDESELTCIDVSDVLEVKKKAIASHASQGAERYLAPEAGELIRYEYYCKVKEKCKLMC